MIVAYIEAVARTLGALQEMAARLALPAAIGIGMALWAAALAQRRAPLRALPDLRALLPHAFSTLALALCLATGWTLLRTVPGVVQRALQSRESADATANPAPDASPVYQSGPSVAVLSETTYTRTLTLPPIFLEHIETEGVGTLAPYLSDPSTDNILRLRDSFQRKGRTVEFTRQVTRLGEEPLALADSQVRAAFQRQEGRAYDLTFEGRYLFANPDSAPRTLRFLFPLPPNSTVRDLRVQVGDALIAEPRADGVYEWKGELRAGERKEARVRYRALGARLYHYDLGSQRRRVQKFTLEAQGAGFVRFLRGSLQPSARDATTLRWSLENVVTAQQIALAFLPETRRKEAYFQALQALGVSFVLFLAGTFALGYRRAGRIDPGALAGGGVLFFLGLIAAPILANYLGPAAGILVGPPGGALLATAALGRRTLVWSLPCALFPAVFLSPLHSGLLCLGLAALTLAGLALTRPRPPEGAA